MPLDVSRLGGVLFDLDGTFADTARDLAFALNETLRLHGRQPLPYQTIRPVVSHGGNALIRLGFNIAPGEPGFTDKRSDLLAVYERNLCRETRLFPGLERVLANLERRGLPWGIVTNKPARLTDPLMTALGMTSRAASIVSGDTCQNRKPHPEPIVFACTQMGVEVERCVYVGDAARDIEAGRAAGAATIAALYGYLLPEDDPLTWAADAVAEHPEDFLRLFGV
jgi:2-phosphoglycolate phosphatase